MIPLLLVIYWQEGELFCNNFANTKEKEVDFIGSIWADDLRML
jgi:hypothetical protein